MSIEDLGQSGVGNVGNVGPAYTPQTEEVEETGYAPGESSIEHDQLLEDSKKIIGLFVPELKVPSELMGVTKQDVSALAATFTVYEESIWDDYLEQLGREADEARAEAKRKDVLTEGITQDRLTGDLRDETELAAQASLMQINLAAVAAFLNPLDSAGFQQSREQAMRVVADKMLNQVTNTLFNTERMTALQGKLLERVENKFADKPPEEQAQIASHWFHTIRATMAFSALAAAASAEANAVNLVASWSADPRAAALKVSFGEGGERLKELLQQELSAMKGVLKEDAKIDEWLSQMSRNIFSSTNARVEMVYSYMNQVLAGSEVQRNLPREHRG